MADKDRDGDEFMLDVLYGVKSEDDLEFAVMKVLGKADHCHVYPDDTHYRFRAASILNMLQMRGVDLSDG